MVSKTEFKHFQFCLFSFHLLLTYFPNHSAYRMSFANFIFYPILLCSLSGQCNMSCLIQAQGYTVLSPTKFLHAYIKLWKQQIIQYNWIKHCLCKPEWKHVETERGGFSITWEETNTTNEAHCYTSSLLCHAHSLQVTTVKSQGRNYRKKNQYTNTFGGPLLNHKTSSQVCSCARKHVCKCVCLCLCVCVCVCVYICMCTCTYVCMPVSIQVCMHECACGGICMHMRICMHVWVWRTLGEVIWKHHHLQHTSLTLYLLPAGHTLFRRAGAGDYHLTHLADIWTWSNRETSSASCPWQLWFTQHNHHSPFISTPHWPSA